MGKILRVDLTNRKIEEEALDEELCHDFVGGYGLGAMIVFSRQRAGVDALGPENILGFLTGPLTGTQALLGSRCSVVAKSPLTSTWGDGNMGGYFGPYLKFSGYDAVLFSGISDKPVYLFINNGDAELRDATHLWGKDAYETDDMLKGKLGEEAQVACIGPAGERLSRIACIMHNKDRAVGQMGLGTVMGSKRLKALAVTGTMRVPVSNKARVKELTRGCVQNFGPMTYYVKKYGALWWSFFEKLGIPIETWGVKNWERTTQSPSDVAGYDPDDIIALQTKTKGCWHCPIKCHAEMKAGTEYDYPEGVSRPEAYSVQVFGAMCLNHNLESIVKCQDIVNRYGVDIGGAGSAIAFALECYEKGLINKQDTDDIELTWGNHRAIVAMLKKLVRMEGFGKVLADGSKFAAERIGKGSEQYAMNIQGKDILPVDFRHPYSSGFGLPQWFEPTPGVVAEAFMTCNLGFRIPGVPPRIDAATLAERGDFTVYSKGISLGNWVQSSGLCFFIVLGLLSEPDVLPELMSAVTGWDYSLDELMETGERIYTLRHAFNLREGLNPLNFRVPPRILGIPPLTDGPLKGITIDKEALDKGFLTAMGWDPITTKPSKKRLEELKLGDIASQIGVY